MDKELRTIKEAIESIRKKHNVKVTSIDIQWTDITTLAAPGMKLSITRLSIDAEKQFTI